MNRHAFKLVRFDLRRCVKGYAPQPIGAMLIPVVDDLYGVVTAHSLNELVSMELRPANRGKVAGGGVEEVDRAVGR